MNGGIIELVKGILLQPLEILVKGDFLALKDHSLKIVKAPEPVQRVAVSIWS